MSLCVVCAFKKLLCCLNSFFIFIIRSRSIVFIGRFKRISYFLNIANGFIRKRCNFVENYRNFIGSPLIKNLFLERNMKSIFMSGWVSYSVRRRNIEYCFVWRFYYIQLQFCMVSMLIRSKNNAWMSVPFHIILVNWTFSIWNGWNRLQEQCRQKFIYIGICVQNQIVKLWLWRSVLYCSELLFAF